MDPSRVEALIQEYSGDSKSLDMMNETGWTVSGFQLQETTSNNSMGDVPYVCSPGHRPFFLIGVCLQAITLFSLFLLIFYFAIKTRFTPKVHIWLTWSCVAFQLWLAGNLVADLMTSDYKCYVSESLMFLSLVLGSLLQVGLCIDRFLSVNSKKPGGGMTDIQIHKCIFALFAVSLFLMILNLVELKMGNLDDLLNKNITGCVSSSTVESHEVKLYCKGFFNIVCLCLTIIFTALTIWKILKTKLNKKKKIVGSLIFMTAAMSFAWMSAIVANLTKLNDEKPLCPMHASGRLGHYLTGLPVFLVFIIHLYFSWNLRKQLSKDPGSGSKKVSVNICIYYNFGCGLSHLLYKDLLNIKKHHI